MKKKSGGFVRYAALYEGVMKQRWIRVEHRQFVAVNSLLISRVMPGLNQFVHVLLRNRAGIESAFGS